MLKLSKHVLGSQVGCVQDPNQHALGPQMKGVLETKQHALRLEVKHVLCMDMCAQQSRVVAGGCTGVAERRWRQTDLLLHGAEAESPAKLVGQVNHEGIYPLRLARVGNPCDNGQLPWDHLQSPAPTNSLAADTHAPTPIVMVMQVSRPTKVNYLGFLSSSIRL